MTFKKKVFGRYDRQKFCSNPECGERFRIGQTIYIETKLRYVSKCAVTRVVGALCQKCYDKKFVM